MLKSWRLGALQSRAAKLGLLLHWRGPEPYKKALQEVAYLASRPRSSPAA